MAVSRRTVAWKVSAIYLAVGALWILFSDRLLLVLVDAPELLTLLQTSKGWFYVLGTAVLLYVLIRHYTGTLEALSGELGRSEERVREVVDTTPDILYTAGATGTERLFFSPKVESLSGFTVEELEQTPGRWFDQVHDEDRGRTQRHMRKQLDAEGGYDLEYRLWHRSGTGWRWLRDRGRLVAAKAGNASLVSGCITDITEQKEYQAQISYLTDHDPLTGLLNQRAFSLVLENLLSRSQPQGTDVVCLCLGVDRLSQCNALYGRHAGDEIVLAIGRALQGEAHAQARGRELLTGRGEGDRFLLALPVPSAEATAFAEGLIAQIERLQLTFGGDTVHISTKIGVACYPHDAAEAGLLISRAERALQVGDASGRKVRLFDSAHHEQDSRALGWVQRIHRAIETDNLVLHFQPILHIPSGRVRHHEVLVRIREADGSLVFPGEFIEAAERLSVIDRIDYRVLEMVLDCLRDLAPDQAGSFAVNLSGVHIGDARLYSWLERKFSETGVDPARLVFEITETSAIRDLSQAQTFMTSAKALGCRFALDDFGIGFTSFSHLRTLPVDFVKIDGTFVRNLHRDRQDRGLVEAIVKAAKAYDKQLVAEFVENETILSMLAGFGVDYAQGFHIGRPRPMTPADFRALNGHAA